MRWVLQTTFYVIFALLVSACGGGGGGSSSAPTPPVTGGGGGGPVVTDTLSVSQSSLNFSATEYEARPDRITVTASVSGSNTAGIVIGTLPGVDELPFWLNVELGEFANNSIDADFVILTTDLPGGDYNFTVRVLTVDSDQTVLDQADITITYSVADGIPVSVAPESIDVVMHLASEPIVETISVTAGNYDWTAFSTDSNLSTEFGSGSQDIELEIFPPMPELLDEEGLYQGRVDIFQEGSTNNAVFLINYTVFPTLDSVAESVALNAVSGEMSGESTGINLRGEGLSWAASSDVGWIVLSSASGTVLSDEIPFEDPAGEEFAVTIDASALSAGRHSGIITVTAEAEQSIVIVVTVEVAEQIIMASKNGIALSETGVSSALQTSIEVRSNATRLVNWAASSDMSWLGVTPSGTIEDAVVVTVDPSSLGNELLHQGVITLSSPDAEITQTIEIPVGFFKSALMPSDEPIDLGSNFFASGFIVSDPVRPFVYIQSGEEEISAINVYSGVIENTITLTNSFDHFAISDDGGFLYLVRSGDNEGFIDVIDLATQSLNATWSYPVNRLSSGEEQRIAFGRVANHPYVVSSTLSFIDAQTGDLALSLVLDESYNRVPIDIENEILCTGFDCYDLISAGFEGATLKAPQRSHIDIDIPGPGGLGDVQLNSDGSELFAPVSRNVAIFDTLSGTEAAILSEPDSRVEMIAAGPDDTLHAVFLNDSDFVDEIRSLVVYDASNNSINTIEFPSFGGIAPILSDVAVSGDGQRFIYVTDEGTLAANIFSIE